MNERDPVQHIYKRERTIEREMERAEERVGEREKERETDIAKRDSTEQSPSERAREGGSSTSRGSHEIVINDEEEVKEGKRGLKVKLIKEWIDFLFKKKKSGRKEGGRMEKEGRG